ncbi:hypothetical protein ACM26V_23585 [Salipaludibacillus sp. HK11]|uniref:hypothetical protein n=1 Tax=Salipaludibacillus sp. HK11 TaxID=3394320 RepID=UPI0039FCB6BA
MNKSLTDWTASQKLEVAERRFLLYKKPHTEFTVSTREHAKYDFEPTKQYIKPFSIIFDS